MLYIVDTSLFVAMGQLSNSRYQTVCQFTRRNDITFVLPEQVYEDRLSTTSTLRHRLSTPQSTKAGQ